MLRSSQVFYLKNEPSGNSLAIQWLGLHALPAEGPGSIPGQGTKIPQAVWWGQEKKKKSLHTGKD